MGFLADRVDEALDALAGRGFDPRLVQGRVIDAGPLRDRARAIARRLNACRGGPPKEPVVLWSAGATGPGFAAVTRRGPWIYVADGLARRLSDDALAFVLAHEMAHHDLGHLRPPMIAAGLLGHLPRMEQMADRHGLRLMRRAGFDPQGALEALSPTFWEPPHPPPPPSWRERLWQTHPPMAERYASIQALLGAGPAAKTSAG